MAWKFDNPWGGGNAQNPWDINGAEAQKILTNYTSDIQEYDNNIKNSEDNIIGWAWYDGIGGEKIYLPTKAERVKNREGKIIRFSFTNAASSFSMTYEAKYKQDDSKQFLGYYENNNKYANPIIT